VNLISTLVTIVALGGGPHYVHPTAIYNSTISVFRYQGKERRPYAVLYEGGELILRLRPGVYSVEARLNNGTAPCQSAKLSIGHRKSQHVRLGCSTK
jgi:hypothetical protein